MSGFSEFDRYDGVALAQLVRTATWARKSFSKPCKRTW